MTKKVGIALGSGSSKGFAHIGVLQALEENRIPIDIISGSSMGAIIGAIYAVGGNMSMLEKIIMNLNIRSMLDIGALQRGGLMKGDRIQELIRILTHDKDFSQTNIPYMCVAVDVETGELLTLNTGKIHECVRASMSMPGFFTPVKIGSHLCVDGGVIERVPCIALKDAGADVIIGVDVGYRGTTQKLEHNSVFEVFELLGNTLDIMAWEMTRSRTQIADVMLTPQVSYMKRFSNDRIDECIEEGRRVVVESMPRILELLDENEIPLRSE